MKQPVVTLTDGELRTRLKDAFLAGFKAARQGTDADAWEESGLRHELDYHGLCDQIRQRPARSRTHG